MLKKISQPSCNISDSVEFILRKCGRRDSRQAKSRKIRRVFKRRIFNPPYLFFCRHSKSDLRF